MAMPNVPPEKLKELFADPDFGARLRCAAVVFEAVQRKPENADFVRAYDRYKKAAEVAHDAEARLTAMLEEPGREELHHAFYGVALAFAEGAKASGL
jgi:hypothetical protein